jgi:hypothetical protein
VYIHIQSVLRLIHSSDQDQLRQFLTQLVKTERDYPLPLAVIHGLVTVSTPGPVQNTFSTEQLQVQDYWDRIIGTETTVTTGGYEQNHF